MTHAQRDRIQRWVSLPHPPEKIWAGIGGFGGMAGWHPGRARTEGAEVWAAARRPVARSFWTPSRS